TPGGGAAVNPIGWVYEVCRRPASGDQCRRQKAELRPVASVARGDVRSSGLRRVTRRVGLAVPPSASSHRTCGYEQSPREFEESSKPPALTSRDSTSSQRFPGVPATIVLEPSARVRLRLSFPKRCEDRPRDLRWLAPRGRRDD